MSAEDLSDDKIIHALALEMLASGYRQVPMQDFIPIVEMQMALEEMPERKNTFLDAAEHGVKALLIEHLEQHILPDAQMLVQRMANEKDGDTYCNAMLVADLLRKICDDTISPIAPIAKKIIDEVDRLVPKKKLVETHTAHANLPSQEEMEADERIWRSSIKGVNAAINREEGSSLPEALATAALNMRRVPRTPRTKE